SLPVILFCQLFGAGVIKIVRLGVIKTRSRLFQARLSRLKEECQGGDESRKLGGKIRHPGGLVNHLKHSLILIQQREKICQHINEEDDPVSQMGKQNNIFESLNGRIVGSRKEVPHYAQRHNAHAQVKNGAKRMEPENIVVQ